MAALRYSGPKPLRSGHVTLLGAKFQPFKLLYPQSDGQPHVGLFPKFIVLFYVISVHHARTLSMQLILSLTSSSSSSLICQQKHNIVHKVDTNIQLARHTRLIEHLQ